MTDTAAEIETVLAFAQQELPQVLSLLALLGVPEAGLVAKFLPLLPVAISAVQTVAQATGGTTAQATAVVVNHLTPGAPDAPALSAGAKTS